MKRVLILGTGGTIVSEAGGEGLTPKENSDAMFRALQELRRYYQIDYRGIMNLDSSNIQLEEWQTIAQNIYTALDEYDGIVVTHGTDTMAYTASVLSFMLQNLEKPVVLTGSQLPLLHPMTDATGNLALALAAVENGIAGVSIAFHHKIIRGCRAVKVRTMGFDAFESVNYPYLAEFSAGGMQQWAPRPRDTEKAVQLFPELCNDIFLLKLIPGTNPEVFDALLNLRYKGIVLEAFGVGGFHFLRRDLSGKISQLVESGAAVVVRSQCLYEQSDFSIYEVGRKVLSSGAIQGWDMTAEACITKLMWALGQTENLEEVRHIFGTNYAGEITLPH